MSEATRRAVLRVSHDLDEAGHVIDVQLEPLHDARVDDVARSAWHAARRCHPWIVGDIAAEQLEAARQIALKQVNHLMNAADEALTIAAGIEHVAFGRLREAVTDLRGYLPALRGEIPVPEEICVRRSA